MESASTPMSSVVVRQPPRRGLHGKVLNGKYQHAGLFGYAALSNAGEKVQAYTYVKSDGETQWLDYKGTIVAQHQSFLKSLGSLYLKASQGACNIGGPSGMRGK